MNAKYLGDSYDIVKRFWADRLAAVAPLVAHPKFVPFAVRTEFEKMVAIPVLAADSIPPEPFGLFLDPDTGIPLPTAPLQRLSASHAPISFIATEIARLSPKYLICFDQSHSRKANLGLQLQRQTKLRALQRLGIVCFYYVSRAPFLFASQEISNLEAVRTCLIQSGIPDWRFEAASASTGMAS